MWPCDAVEGGQLRAILAPPLLFSCAASRNLKRKEEKKEVEEVVGGHFCHRATRRSPVPLSGTGGGAVRRGRI